MRQFIYAGIGSRETPLEVYTTMIQLAEMLASSAWILRSGHADGADRAFEIGANRARGDREIYLPWWGYNGIHRAKANSSYSVPDMTPEFISFAAKYHPNWGMVSDGAKKLLARNSCQILGPDITNPKPCDMVICWTKRGLGEGGTGQALRIAKAYDIPIFDLALTGSVHMLASFVNNLEQIHA